MDFILKNIHWNQEERITTKCIHLLIVFLSLILLVPFNLSGQTTNYDFNLINVHFLNDITIVKDHTLEFNQSYAPPQWKTNEVRPVAYSSDDLIKVKATIRFVCSQTPPPIIWIRGKGSEGHDFEIRAIEPIPAGSDYIIAYPETFSSEVLEPFKARTIESFTINWQWSMDNPFVSSSVIWTDLGQSENTVYITHKPPKLPLAGFRYYHTLFKLSCNAADGFDNEEDIISNIWNSIKAPPLDIRTAVNNIPLTYYENWIECFDVNGATSTAALLLNHDGQCGSFTRLFLDLLKIHGIQEPFSVFNHLVIRGEVTPNQGNDNVYSPDRILVKDWTIPDGFGSPLRNPIASNTGHSDQYTRIAIIPSVLDLNQTPPVWVPDNNTFLSGNNYNWWYNEELNDGIGVKGQSNPNPASIFSNHQIAAHDGKYYDPSYGLEYIDIPLDMEQQTISAYGELSVIITSETELGQDIDGISGNNDDIRGFMILFISKDIDVFELKVDPSTSTNY